MSKSRLVVLAALLFCSNLYGQIYVKPFIYRPTGELGLVLKPQFSLEAGYMQSFEEDRWRSSVGFTFMKMKPRMDVFPTYGVLSDGSGTHVLPGAQTFTRYNVFELYAGADYSLIEGDKFFPYLGLDIVLGARSMAYTNYVAGISEESFSGGSVLGGLRGRIGVEYAISDMIGIFLTVNRQVFLVTDPAGIYGANDYGLGVRIQFY